MNAWLEASPDVVPWLAGLVKLTALLCVGWMLHILLLPRNPHWRVILWRCVIVGLVALPAMESLLPAIRLEVPAPPALRIRYVPTPLSLPDDDLRRFYAGHKPDPGSYEQAASPTPRQTPLAWAMAHRMPLLLSLWATAALVLLARTARLSQQVRQIVREATPADAALLDRLHRVAGDVGCATSVRLRVTEARISPLVAGVRRPTIVLPRMVADSPDHLEIDGIFAHELAHVRNRDLFWLLAARVLVCLLWFHPLLWRMPRAHMRACEEVCDGAAAAHVGGAPIYSGMLARTALHVLADAPADGGVSLVRSAMILQRIQRLKRGILATSLGHRWIAAIVVPAGLCLLTLGSLRIAYAEKPAAASSRTTTALATAPSERRPVMAVVKHEGSRVWIEGLPSQSIGPISPQSQMQLLQILLRHRGEAAEANDLLALSGDAFNTCHAAHWDGAGPYLLVPTDPLARAAEAYGYESRWLSDDLRFHQLNRLPPEQKQRKLDEMNLAIGKQIEAGRPVLMGGAYGLCGAWRVVAGIDTDKKSLCYVGGERPYDWVDIGKDAKVAEFGFWDEQVRGAFRPDTMGGWHSNVAFFLEGKTHEPSRKDRLLQALKLAVDLFQDRQVGQTEAAWLGRNAYERWVEDLHKIDQETDPPKADAKALAARYNNMTAEVGGIAHGRAAAADFLDAYADELPKAAERLRSAAKHYRSEATIAKEGFPILLAGDTKAIGAWLAEKANRESAAKAVLRMMAQDESAVAEISSALAGEGVELTVAIPVPAERIASKAKIVRQDGEVWIGGAEKLTWPEGSENTVLRTFAAALNLAGREVTYEQVMGLGGAAFRIQVMTKGLCPSSPHAFCGYNCLKPAMAALGYTTVAYPYPQDDPDGVQRARAAIVDGIDHGWPALFGSEESGIVVGYKDAGRTLLVRPPYGSKGPGFEEWTGWPWGFALFRPSGTSLSARDAAVASLKQAVRLANSQSFGAYTAGFAAYDRWIAILESQKEFPHDEKDKAWEQNLLGNAFMYSCLLDARRCAARYLTSIGNTVNSEAGQHIGKAADLYRQIAAALEAGWSNIRFPWRVAKEGPYTPEMRAAETRTLKQVRDLERKAIAELAEALKAEEAATATSPAEAN